MSIVLMQKTFEEPASDELIGQMQQATEVCFEINDVVRTRSYLSSDRKHVTCVFEARDVASVQRALDSAGMTYEKIWAVTEF